MQFQVSVFMRFNIAACSIMLEELLFNALLISLKHRTVISFSEIYLFLIIAITEFVELEIIFPGLVCVFHVEWLLILKQIMPTNFSKD